MDDQSGPRPDAGPEIRSSTPLCRRCRRQNFEPMVVNAGVVCGGALDAVTYGVNRKELPNRTLSRRTDAHHASPRAHSDLRSGFPYVLPCSS